MVTQAGGSQELGRLEESDASWTGWKHILKEVVHVAHSNAHQVYHDGVAQ